MPSDRPQINVRLDPDAHARLGRLVARVPRALGTALSQAQVIGLALKALEEKYPDDPPGGPAAGPPATPARRPRGRPKTKA